MIDHPLPLVDSDSQPIEVQVPEVVKAKERQTNKRFLKERSRIKKLNKEMGRDLHMFYFFLNL